MNTEKQLILFFDGYCNLCNWAVRFVLKYDKKARIHFSSLQSPFAKQNLLYANGQDKYRETVIYRRGGKIYTKSRAVIETANDLGGIWKIVNILKIIPVKLADRLYDLIADNRYRWFGKKNECLLPDRKMAARFID